MSTRLVPNIDHWPETVKSASLLMGTLERSGPGYRPVGWPESPRTRCNAIAAFLGTPFVAVDETAAWVWGAFRDPGVKLHLSTKSGRVPFRAAYGDAEFSQFKFNAGDYTLFDGRAVTTRLRTAFDLLRSKRPFTQPRRVASRLLIVAELNGRERVLDRAAHSSRGDYLRVLERIRECYGP